MPRLLARDTLDPQRPLRHRWTAILAAALALTAWQTDWPAAWDTARGLAPVRSDLHEWDGDDLAAAPGDTTGLTAGIDEPDTARTARLDGDGVRLELAWEPQLEVTAVRVETYRDAYGTGLRLGIAADTTTASGPDCLNARATAAGRTTTLQWCTHTVQHEPVDMAAFLGKETDGGWAPETLFITQTANLDAGRALIDYYGLGAYTGDAFETGLWPVGIPVGGDHADPCHDPGLRLRIDDLHLTDRYDDPAEHTRSIEEVHDPRPAFPAEGRLLSPACASISSYGPFETVTLKPLRTDRSTPLSEAGAYRATTRDVLPVRAAAVIDTRTCDTQTAYCTADAQGGTWSATNEGPGRTWIAELLAPGPR